MRKLTFTLALTALVAACGPRGGGEIPVLDVTSSYPAKDIVLQDIATVEYIPLETREGFLVDYLRVDYMDDEIFVTNNRAGDIMVFDRKTGKGVRSFNRAGRGPGEYSGIYTLAVDKEGGEMFVAPGSLSSADYPVYVYDLDGKPLRTLRFKEIQFPSFFHNHDKESLFFYNSRSSQEPYGLISKTDTLVTYLPVRFESRGTMMISHTFEDGGITAMWQGDPIARTRDGFMLSEPGVDTMFRWSAATRELIPVMAHTPSFNSMEFPIGVFFKAESDDYMFVQTIERKYDWSTNTGFKSKDLIYDKRAGEFYEGGAVNEDFADERMFNFVVMPGVPAGVHVSVLQPYELLDLHAEGKLRGRLAEIAAGLKEDDNPVMMIATLK